jgi:integrase
MRLPALRQSAQLQPHELSEASEQAVSELLRQGQSANTVISYKSALRYWAGWFNVRYGIPINLPVPVAAVLQFIVDHADRTVGERLVHELPAALDAVLVEAGIKGMTGSLSLNTIVHRVSVLSKAHQLHADRNPCADSKVRELLASTRRAYTKRGALPHKKDALTREPLLAAIETCDASLRGLRDRALLLFAWSTGGRRRSEVAAADLQFLTPTADGEYSYNLAHSKTNQAGADRPENHKPLVGEAAAAMSTWLEAAGIKEGKIFRQVGPGRQLGESLSADAVADIVRRRCALAGLSGDFSAHSVRSGFVTAAGQQGAALSDVMALTGHRSVQTVMGYARPGARAQRKLVSSMLTGRDPEPGSPQ